MRTSGPLFDGRAEADLEEGLRAIQDQVARAGADMARQAFAGMIRENHGRFLESITTTDRSRTYSTVSGRHVYAMEVVADTAHTSIVTTSIASYGPWLEGTGSRNETTRFKGYHGFRLAGEELDRRAGEIAEGALRPYAERMS